MTSVFQGLCLSRSMGRVGENPGYEVVFDVVVAILVAAVPGTVYKLRRRLISNACLPFVILRQKSQSDMFVSMLMSVLLFQAPLCC